MDSERYREYICMYVPILLLFITVAVADYLANVVIVSALDRCNF